MVNQDKEKVDYGWVKTMIMFLPFVAQRKPN